MPGIVALVTRIDPSKAKAHLSAMLQSLKHTPCYDSGIWSDDSLGVYVGWTARRSNVSLAMPLRNRTGDVLLIFAGEDYSPRDVRQQPRDAGEASEGQRASYLLHLAETDPSFPDSLNGRFHGILVDRSRRIVRLFNDRFGLHRLYFHECEDGFYCAAEAKAILSVRPELRELDLASLGELIACGCVLEYRSLFRGVKIMPPASCWTLRDGTVSTRRTFFSEKQWEDVPTVSSSEFYKKLREAFQTCLPHYFYDKVIGMSLTGGLDTRMILAWRHFTPGTILCYSFGGMFRESQDVRIARQLAQCCGHSHHVISVGTEFLSRFPHYAERSVYLTDGCLSVSHSPDLYVNEIAATISPVRMTGNYGGEVLRGIRAFKPRPAPPALFVDDLAPHFLSAAQRYAAALNTHPITFAVFRQLPWHHFGLWALEQSQLEVRSPFLDNHLLQTAYQAPRSCLQGADMCLRLIRDGDPSLMQIPTDRGLAGTYGWLRASTFRKYLDLTAKAEYAYDYGMPHWVAALDHFLSPLKLERVLLGQHKFYHFRLWYRDALRQYVQDMLLDSRSLARPYVKRNTVEMLVHEHIRGTANHTTAIHTLITLELIHRLFVDAS